MLWLVPATLWVHLSLPDLVGMFLERGFEFTHEAVRDWEARFAPLVADKLRAKRKRVPPAPERAKQGSSWRTFLAQ